MLKFVANEWLDSTGSGCCPMTKFSEVDRKVEKILVGVNDHDSAAAS